MTHNHNRESDNPQRVQRTRRCPTQTDSAKHPAAPEAQPAYPHSLLGDSLLSGRGNEPVRTAVLQQMQQTYGNRAVQRYIRRLADSTTSLHVQRDDPKPGWSEVNSGPNAGETKVTTKDGTIRRIPIEGLKEGNQNVAKDTDGDTNELAAKTPEKKGKGVVDSAPKGQAVVLIPAGLDPKKTVEVLLHLHGFGIGWRMRAKAGGEPGMEVDTVRDVALNKIEAQMAASGRGQMIGVLPQGGLQSEFGKNFSTDAYLTDVFGRLEAMKILPALKDLKVGNIVLTGHSGAGGTFSGMLPNKSRLPSTVGRLAEVVLFDAINGEGELSSATNWVKAQLNGELKVIAAESDKVKQRDFVVNKGMRFRGYHTPSTWPMQARDKDGKKVWEEDPETKKKKPVWIIDDTTKKPKIGGYLIWYKELKSSIDGWFGGAGKAYTELAKSLRGVKGETLDPDVLAKLRANYEVKQVDKGVTHEGVIGSGKLQEALGALQRTPASGAHSGTGRVTPGAKPMAGKTVVEGGERASFPVQRTRVNIQRGPGPGASGDPDQALWEADWNSSAYSSARGSFSENGRPAGAPKERYDKLCPLYKAHGIPRPLQYLSAQIDYSTTFFGHKTHANTGMQALLTAAENTLKALKDDKGNLKYTGSPFKQRPWALTVRTTSTGAWSNHADGKAIDLDPDTNPHLLNAAHRAVITTLTGVDIEKANPGEGTGLDSYDADKLASDRFKASYNEAGMSKRIEELKPGEAKLTKERDELVKKQSDLVKSKQQTKKDRDVVLKDKSVNAQGRKEARDAAKAAIDEIDKQSAEVKAQLTTKNAALKDAQKQIKLLEDELKKYKAEQKKYDAATKAVETAEGDVTGSSAEVGALSTEAQEAQKQVDAAQKQVESAKKEDLLKLKKELDALKKARTAKKTALAKAQMTLKKEEKTLTNKKEARDAFTLRKYAQEGFLDLPKDVVVAMKGAGFTWGGDWKTHKDLMHFDMP